MAREMARQRGYDWARCSETSQRLLLQNAGDILAVPELAALLRDGTTT